MKQFKKYKFLSSRSAGPAISSSAFPAAPPAHTRSISQDITNNTTDTHPINRLDLSLDCSIAGFKALKELAEVIPVVDGPLKASCGVIIWILQLVKRCKENREGWEKLSDIMKEKNDSILALLELYSKAPVEYPSAERQAGEYQQVLNSIAIDIKKETQRKKETSQGLEMYWSRMQATGREAVLANINAERIVFYQEQIRNVTFDVIEKTVIHQALSTTQGFNDMKVMLMEQATTVNDVKTILVKKSSSKGSTAVLKPRPRKVKDFVGRNDILDSMCETHFGNESAHSHGDGPSITVLTGMGGSGKTQIAVNFASIFEERFPNVPVFFLDASSETSLNADLATLARSQTEKYDDDALTWLANGIDNWLLIMDNADDSSFKLSTFLPRAAHGHVIVTTRNATHRLLSPQSSHAVDVLPIEDSIALLLKASASEDNETNRLLAKEIAEELGRLPLVIAHAAAYILINNCLDTFLATYSESRNQFLQRTPDLPQDYPHSVERTIEMSFARLSSNVKGMITLFAYMDARSIARCVIARAAKRRFLHIPYQSELPPQTDTILHAKILQDIFCREGEWKSFEFDGMIEECLKYSLLQVTTTDNKKFYSIHPLVQMYIRSESSTVCDCSAPRLVIRLLASATTVGRWYEFFSFNRLLSPHVRLVRVEEVVEAGDHFGFGVIFSEEGNRLGITHLERCVHIWKSSLGENVQATLEAMVTLSNSYQSLGRAQEALPLQEEVLKRRRQLLGADHLDTLVAMNSLANSYHSLRRVEEALPLREEIFRKRKRLLGPDHLDTLNAMNNLANSYKSLRRAEEALPLQEEVLEKRRQFLGPDHPNTLVAMNNLANSYKSLGRAEEALPLQEEVLLKRRRLLGLNHLDTLMAMNNLANSYQSLGRLQEALLLQEEVLQNWNHLLGRNHLDTLMAMNNLANSYQLLGRLQEAFLLQEEVLQKWNQLLGPDHLDTLMAMNNLANSYQSLGKVKEALLLQEEVLQKRKRLLAPDHLDTLMAMNDLANSYRLLGREQEALLIAENVLEKREMLLGLHHRDTLGAMYNLLLSYRQLSMEKELKALATTALPLYEKVFGIDHERTLWIRSLLG
ncbi:hypothetical protein FRC15_005920 [Serendipita sp. 397]|nr:hypothetical protein FRC15_005920 [Serendipita sp. 397]